MEYESYHVFLTKRNASLQVATVTTIFEFEHYYQCIVTVVMDVIS